MLKLSRAEYDAIRRHGEEVYPEECCGILVGTAGEQMRQVDQVVRSTNVHPSPRKRYEIDVREVIRLQRTVRERGLEVVGFYHSHPDHAPEWSPTDIEDAWWIGYSYVITSVEQGKAVETKSWLLTGTWEDKCFEAEDLAIE